MPASPDISFQLVIDALLDVDKPFHARFYHRLSDLEPDELELLSSVWPNLPIERRIMVMEGVEAISASDYMLNFVEFCRFTLGDIDPGVRQWALRTLWDYEDKDLIPLYLDLSKNDKDPVVRAAAANGLGQYVYAGEIDELQSTKLKTIEDHLLEILGGNDAESVRRAALESLGYSSRAEVHPKILDAFALNDRLWKASALLAMGRSANRIYKPEVMAMLESKLPVIRKEAARAAGEIELAEARPYLLELLDDPDEAVRSASIWALSEIGGDDVRETLERLSEELEDPEELELLEAALENLTFSEGLKLMPLFEFPEVAEDEVEWNELTDEDDSFDEEADPED